MRLNLLARQHGELVTGRKRTVPTFGEAVETVIAVHAAGWKDGGRSEKLWRSSLRDYAMPKLGGRPVNRINRADVMAVLLPIWNEKRVTARRVRQRISAVMRWAVAQGYREDNPAEKPSEPRSPRMASGPSISPRFRMRRSPGHWSRCGAPGRIARPCWPSSSWC